MDRNPKKLYVGNLPPDCTEDTLATEFSPFGTIQEIEFKGRYGFVEFESASSASSAAAALDGLLMGKEKVRPYNHSARQSRNRGVGGAVRTDYRVDVQGLSLATTWQDLKDFGRKVGEVNYADVTDNSDGTKKGVIEFRTLEDMQMAVQNLSNVDFLGNVVRVSPSRNPISREVRHHSGGGGIRSRASYSAPRDVRREYRRPPPDSSYHHHHHHHHHEMRNRGGGGDHYYRQPTRSLSPPPPHWDDRHAPPVAPGSRHGHDQQSSYPPRGTSRRDNRHRSRSPFEDYEVRGPPRPGYEPGSSRRDPHPRFLSPLSRRGGGGAGASAERQRHPTNSYTERGSPPVWRGGAGPAMGHGRRWKQDYHRDSYR